MTNWTRWDAVKRKAEIVSITEELALTYSQFPISPELIAREEGITFCYGNYEDTFDGLLQHKSGRFHIFINLDRLVSPDSERTRFTFAHELGHYFIDTHRNALKQGLVPQHPSIISINQKNPIEKEADYFAACLLMPETIFKSFCYKRPLSGRLIDDLSLSFRVSKLAVVFRYFSLNMFPMALVFSKEGKIVWSWKTNDFRLWSLPSSGDIVPLTTAAGEFFKGGKVYRREEIVYVSDWYKGSKELGSAMFEKCFYNSFNNSVLSVIWFKE